VALAVVGVGGVQLEHGALSVGDLFAILMLAGKVSAPLLSSVDVARQFQDLAVAVKELGRLLEAPLDRANVELPLRTPLKQTPSV
jgi:ATP-binding cassette subfamily B protein